MNLFQLVIKQMRQRALGTWLTLLSVTLGVGLAITILILYREAGDLFGQKDFGCDVILGKPGSGTQLVMNTLYHIDTSLGNIPYTVYEEMLRPDRSPAAAVPIIMGDNFKGDPVVGTSAAMFGINEDTGKPLEAAARLEYQPGHSYQLGEGRCFAIDKFEAVIGSDVAANDGLKIGSTFSTTDSQHSPDDKAIQWTVVGVMKQTLTAADGSIYIPIRSYLAVEMHGAPLKAGMESPATAMATTAATTKAVTTGPTREPATAPATASTGAPAAAGITSPSGLFKLYGDGSFNLMIPEGFWQISGILAKTPPPPQPSLPNRLIEIITARKQALAVNPTDVMKQAAPTLPTDLGFNIVIGSNKNTPQQLVKSLAFHVGKPAGMIPYTLYEQYLPNSMLPKPAKGPGEAVEEAEAQPAMNFFDKAKIAVPIAVGDTYQGKWRIIATTTNLFGIDDETGVEWKTAQDKRDNQMPYRKDKYYEFADGHCFAPNRFEAILGSDTAEKSGLKIGSTFNATHGETMPKNDPDIHPEVWKVVGILKKTFTSNDACVFIPIKTDYTVEEHSKGMKIQWLLHHGMQADSSADPDDIHTYKIKPDGTFDLYVPRERWEVSAIMIKSRGLPQGLIYDTNNRSEAIAVNPAQTMIGFFDTFLKGPTLVLLVVAFMVSIVAAVGILVSIYNSVAARMREIAIMRALGATRARVLELICIEAGLIGLFGGIIGLVAGHLMGAYASLLFNKFIGQGINWVQVDIKEVYYLICVVVVAVLAGLVPAMKAYRTPVATNLVVV